MAWPKANPWVIQWVHRDPVKLLIVCPEKRKTGGPEIVQGESEKEKGIQTRAKV
jgi:hypothetical protein